MSSEMSGLGMFIHGIANFVCAILGFISIICLLVGGFAAVAAIGHGGFAGSNAGILLYSSLMLGLPSYVMYKFSCFVRRCAR